MPAIQKPKQTSLNVRLSEPQRQQLENRASALGWTVSELLRHVVACYFEARGE
jgi:predicted DNA binding CopG/RHH family protein